MDINEFVKRVQPRAKRSRLDPFKQQIFELKALGYANWQIRDWLASNGIEVTQESVRKFVATRGDTEKQPTTQQPVVIGKQPEIDTDLGSVASPSLEGKSNTATPDAEMVGLSPKQRREKRADQFIKSENTNPVLKVLKKQKDP